MAKEVSSSFILTVRIDRSEEMVALSGACLELNEVDHFWTQFSTAVFDPIYLAPKLGLNRLGTNVTQF